MKLNRWLLLLIVPVVISTALLWRAFQQATNEQDLTVEQIANRAAQLYNGEIIKVGTHSSMYIVSIQRTNNVVEATMTKDGHVQKLELITDSNETNVPDEPSSVKLTHSEAEAIALKQLAGEVDESRFVETNDGGYYLIEIESEDEEATFQIHALTGDILSVKYDD